MTRDDIIRMADEVGYPLALYDEGPYLPPMLVMLLEKAVAAEREACARVCDERINSLNDRVVLTALAIRDAIRARGQK